MELTEKDLAATEKEMPMKLLNAFALTGLTAFSTSAHADGFVCQTTDGTLNVKIYNSTDPSVGTRVGAVMILSDPSVSEGRKTIARFSDANGVLESRGSRYEADVDLRFNDSSRKGELILGTKLGQLDAITVDIDFSYAAPVEAGNRVNGEIVLAKRDGSRVRSELACSRHLKN